MSSPVYTGPSVPDMIASHSLAENIIKYHNHPESDCILDEDELALLRRFVEHPENRDSILKDEGVATGIGEGSHGSLVQHIVSKHGNGNVLTESEIEMLRVWFAKREL
ncbi:hypothetical protein P153DRAFT_398475 [Dothidotthia symphoricarpi CBS 119687]|uniref:Uncharacterized protein n=1 Tax=Dothidotthia symphoricarpi CBS 119687 TaxID=1392245 RepID=A0A6A6A7A6_9PLEO|nr:uncharacterized protein P153DRAFT_398475 [Dothidotthia symphoricarpi CBS 119687]KAF2127105.1 hypothetical protein P153DRAFT_398475 [Dothidotthia symphoricarpi CBS 119687]